MPEGGRASERNVGAWATLGVGTLLLGVFGAIVGAQVARALADGFTFDWYVHAPIRAMDGVEFAWWAGRVAAAAALAGAAVALGLLFGVRQLLPARVVAARRARTRSLHALVTLLVLPVAAGLLAAELYWLLGGPRWQDIAFVAGLALAGGVAGGASFAAAWLLTRAGLASGRIVRGRAEDNLIGRVMLLSARHARPVLVATLLLSGAAAYGASTLVADVDVVDVLPRGDPNTVAAHNLSERFKSAFTLQVTAHARIDPEKHAEDETRLLPYRVSDSFPENITDEVYVRAIDEMADFWKEYVPPGWDHAPFRSSVSLPSFYRLINWTAADGRNAPDESYALPSAASPQDSGRYALVHDGVWRLIPEAATALISPDFEQAAVLLMVSPTEEATSEQIGRAALAARDAYVAWAETNPDAFRVFTGDNAPLFTVDIPIANAHQTDLANDDFRLLLPLIALFLAACLWLQFQDWRPILIAFAAVAGSTLWTFGLMGYLELPLNTVNLTVVPLIMGVGIDYGIHVLNEYQHTRAAGHARDAAFARIGARSGLSLFIATATSILGVAVMIVSPSLLIAQLGLLCCIALGCMYLLTVTFIPAAAGALDPSRSRVKYTPSRIMRAAAHAVGGQRVLVLAVLALVVVAALASSQSIEREPFGDPPRNWLDDDPLRQEHELAGKRFYDSPEPDAKANVLVFEGDVMDPAAHHYMDALEAELRGEERVMSHTLRTVPFLMRTYLTVRDGLDGAAQYMALDNLALAAPQLSQGDPYPDTREEIVALAEEAHQTPLREFADLFYAWPDQTIAAMTFTARAATFEEAVEVWDQVWGAIERVESQRPDGLTVAFAGNTATNYLFVEKQVPWIHKMAPVVGVAVVALVLALTRDVKAAVVVGIHNVVTAIVWLGMLPPLGVGLSITLTLPLVFIFALGSDYALHLSLACRENDSAKVFETTGKAILFSAVTTLGAFLIFAQVSNLAVQRAMVATAAAIVALFVVTTLLIPALYPPKRREVTLVVEPPAPTDAASGAAVPATSARKERVPLVTRR